MYCYTKRQILKARRSYMEIQCTHLTGLYKEAGRKVMHPYSLLHIVCLYTSINAKAVPPKFLCSVWSKKQRKMHVNKKQ